MKPYFYVFRVGGSHPRIKHPTLQQAHAESLRLAAQHPGDSFEILQCLGITQTTTPQTFWNDGFGPPERVEPCPECGHRMHVEQGTFRCHCGVITSLKP